MKLSTGKIIDSGPGDVVGIDDEGLNLYSRWQHPFNDAYRRWYFNTGGEQREHENLTKEELLEVADIMLDRWENFKTKVNGL